MHNNLKKGQEEIVGFILVVVLVVVILVIFLGIQLRNPEPEQRQSEVLYQFLESSMEQTTNCTLSEGASYLALDGNTIFIYILYKTIRIIILKYCFSMLYYVK